MESRFCPKINESVLLRYFTKQLTDREAECVEEWIQASEKNRQLPDPTGTETITDHVERLFAADHAVVS